MIFFIALAALQRGRQQLADANVDVIALETGRTLGRCADMAKLSQLLTVFVVALSVIPTRTSDPNAFADSSAQLQEGQNLLQQGQIESAFSLFSNVANALQQCTVPDCLRIRSHAAFYAGVAAQTAAERAAKTASDSDNAESNAATVTQFEHIAVQSYRLALSAAATGRDENTAGNILESLCNIVAARDVPCESSAPEICPTCATLQGIRWEAEAAQEKESTSRVVPATALHTATQAIVAFCEQVGIPSPSNPLVVSTQNASQLMAKLEDQSSSNILLSILQRDLQRMSKAGNVSSVAWLASKILPMSVSHYSHLAAVALSLQFELEHDVLSEAFFRTLQARSLLKLLTNLNKNPLSPCQRGVRALGVDEYVWDTISWQQWSSKLDNAKVRPIQTLYASSCVFDREKSQSLSPDCTYNITIENYGSQPGLSSLDLEWKLWHGQVHIKSFTDVYLMGPNAMALTSNEQCTAEATASDLFESDCTVHTGAHFFHNPFWQDVDAAKACFGRPKLSGQYVHFMQCCLHNYGHFLTEGKKILSE